MGAEVHCAINAAAASVSEAAAASVRAFFPDVLIDLAEGVAALSAPGRTEKDLVAIWSSALANEMLLATQQENRARVMNMLLQ